MLTDSSCSSYLATFIASSSSSKPSADHSSSHSRTEDSPRCMAEDEKVPYDDVQTEEGAVRGAEEEAAAARVVGEEEHPKGKLNEADVKSLGSVEDVVDRARGNIEADVRDKVRRDREKTISARENAPPAPALSSLARAPSAETSSLHAKRRYHLRRTRFDADYRCRKRCRARMNRQERSRAMKEECERFLLILVALDDGGDTAGPADEGSSRKGSNPSAKSTAPRPSRLRRNQALS
ncbi:hypothetical protein JCM11251_000121 [Rhodosporidiobolus azoricus]